MLSLHTLSQVLVLLTLTLTSLASKTIMLFFLKGLACVLVRDAQENVVACRSPRRCVAAYCRAGQSSHQAWHVSSSCRKAISRENTTGEEHKQTRSQDRFCLCSQDRVCLCSSCGVSYEGQCKDRRRARSRTNPSATRCSRSTSVLAGTTSSARRRSCRRP